MTVDIHITFERYSRSIEFCKSFEMPVVPRKGEQLIINTGAGWAYDDLKIVNVSHSIDSDGSVCITLLADTELSFEQQDKEALESDGWQSVDELIEPSPHLPSPAQ